jgi:hypothetical protein
MRVCMYVCMYSYVRMYVCVCIYVYMYVCMYVCMYACMHVCMYACMHVCMYVCMSICMYICMYEWCSYACMYVCVYVCMYVCMYEINNQVLLILEYFTRLNFGNLSYIFQFQQTDNKDEFYFYLFFTRKIMCKNGVQQWLQFSWYAISAVFTSNTSAYKGSDPTHVTTPLLATTLITTLSAPWQNKVQVRTLP